MSTVTCDLCARPVADLAHVCAHCAHPFTLDLQDVPALDAELDVTVSKLARIGSGGGRSSEPRMPVNLDADVHGRRLKAVLGSWADLIADQRGIPAPLDGLAPVSRWLLGHVTWLRHHPAGADCVVEVRDAVRGVRRAIDRPQERLYAGTCACGTPLYAKPGAAQVTCGACATPDNHAAYDVAERRNRMLAELQDMQLPAADIARALTSLIRPIAPALLYTWVSRQRLTPCGADRHGRALFRVGDVADLMLATARKAS